MGKRLKKDKPASVVAMDPDYNLRMTKALAVKDQVVVVGCIISVQGKLYAGDNGMVIRDSAIIEKDLYYQMQIDKLSMEVELLKTKKQLADSLAYKEKVPSNL